MAALPAAVVLDLLWGVWHLPGNRLGIILTWLVVLAELRRHGLTPRVIDRAPAPATTSRAMVVQPRTLEVFDDMGIAGQALARGREVRGFTGVFAGREPIRLHLGADLSKTPELDTAYPRLLMLPQDHTEALLAEHLEGLGVRVERDVALESYREAGDGVVATLRAGGKAERRRRSTHAGSWAATARTAPSAPGRGFPSTA
jgi:2-polyprenyl-6-methoxyphenol hydroxylase-like FAD-dependent oxidoreductase